MYERKHRTSPGNAAATTAMFALLGVVALAAAYVSMLFPLGIPSCSEGPKCPHPPIMLAMTLIWLSIPVSVIAGVVGAVAFRRGKMYLWPLAGTGMIIGTTVFAFLLASNP